ncbi:MAG: DUF1566 domain-containing protein [Deltaproteobacteria bacterium]|nr:DUF1566 domain-containing protein [Deltaproteobacteria bacterium]
MKKLTFIAALVLVLGTCFTVSAFADFYVIPIKKGGIKSAITVPKTGETLCYTQSGGETDCAGTGQDGEYQLGITPAVAPNSLYPVYGWTGTRFTDNNDGTVTDNLTGLIWLKNANCFGTQNWTNALNDCNSLNDGECGLTDGSFESDWRLPNINEMRSLVDPSGESDPALPDGHPFTNVQSSYYWSSTTYESVTDSAWLVYMFDGLQVYSLKDSIPYVWPVRSDN